MAKNKRKVGRPFAPLFYPACLIVYLVYKLKYGLRIDRSGMKDIKGPALVLAQHLSGKDHVISALTIFPKRPTFVASEHFLLNPLLKLIFKWMHIITKKMFCADVATIIKMMRAKEEKNIIVLFPEGRLPANGVSVPVTDGTSALIKKLEIDVYFIRGEGSYHLFPKWGKSSRKGKINVITKKIIESSQIKDMSLSDIEAILDKEFEYDEDKNPRINTINYRAKDTTLGLDGLLWKCPNCKSDWSLVTKDSHIRCECGLDAELLPNYSLKGVAFKTLSDWHKWQTLELYNKVGKLDAKADFGTPGEDGKLIRNAGSGYIYIDKDKFYLDGDVLGEKISIDSSLDKIGGFPVTIGEHFDVYYKGKLIYVYPSIDKRSSIQWVAFLDEYNIQNKK